NCLRKFSSSRTFWILRSTRYSYCRDSFILGIEHTNRTDHYLEKLNAFWGVVEPSLLSLLFLLIGIEAAPYLIHDYWFYVIIIFIASILVRLLVVSGTIKLFSKMDHIDLKQSIIIAWSGIKGTMSIFLLLT